MILTIAWRNVLRHWRRSISTGIAISIGMSGLLLFGGYNVSIYYSLQTAFIRTLGHLQIQHEKYLTYGLGDPTKYTITGYKKIIDDIKNDSEIGKKITVITPTLTMSGVASYPNEDTSRTVLINGYEEGGFLKLAKWDAYNIEPPLEKTYRLSDLKNAAAVGSNLALTLKLCDYLPYDDSCNKQLDNSFSDIQNVILVPNDLAELLEINRKESERSVINLLVSNNSGVPNIGVLNVVGVEEQSSRELDSIYLGVNLSYLQSLVYRDEKKSVNSILIQLDKTDDMKFVSNRIEKYILNNYNQREIIVREFTEIQPLYDRIISMFNGIFGFVSILIIIIVVFSVSNTINMSVLERTNEIGTVRAIGLTKKWTNILFILEALILGFIGSIAGLIMATTISFIINWLDLTWHPPGVVGPQLIKIYIWSEWWLISMVFISIMIVAFIASIIPAYKSTKINIVDALRYT